MHISDQSVDSWLDSLKDTRADDIRELDRIIGDVFTGDSRVLWVGTFWGGTEQTIIGYGDLVQARPSGETVHWFVVGVALQKTHISIYVNAVKDGQYLGKTYGKGLGKVKIGSASIGFRNLANMEIHVLIDMLRDAHALTR